jgi:hypothetical protein
MLREAGIKKVRIWKEGLSEEYEVEKVVNSEDIQYKMIFFVLANVQ